MLQSQIHYQQQILSAAMRQSLKILQLSMSGLQTELVRFAEENPMVDLDQFYIECQLGTSDGNMMLYEDFSGSLFLNAQVLPSRPPMERISLRLLIAVQINNRKRSPSI